MKKVLLLLVLLFSFALVSTPVVNADFRDYMHKVKMPHFEDIDVNTKLDKQDHELKISFSDLKYVKKVSYELTYKHSLGEEGIMGEFDVNGEKRIKKEIFLGTCSTGGTCVNHTKISKMKLKVRTIYGNPFNKTETETFSIK